MINIVITGHGNYASGILSAVNLIVGNPENLVAVDFLSSDSAEVLADQLERSVSNASTQGTLVFCDLLGGTPFKQAVLLKSKHLNLEVVAGANLPMVAECIVLRQGMSLAELTDHSVNVGKEGIEKYVFKHINKENEIEGI